ncbi:MAG: DUF6600 domain-containing protein, partial [Bacteroidota bacterium]
MKRILMFAAALGFSQAFMPATALAAPPLQLYGGVSVGFGRPGYFYSSLRTYGEWIELEPGFHVWRPLRVRHGWRPYLYGRWAWTDYGWYWVSDEPFGWAVFHYGRWYYDDFYGWIWVPDNVWGPSWVEWRYNDDYIGWAPLPPYATFSISIGIRYTTRWIAPAPYWCFVRYRHFTGGSIYRYREDDVSTRRLIGRTRSSGSYDVERDRIINRGVDRNVIERRGNVRISRVEVLDSRERGERVIRGTGSTRIEVHRPSRSDIDQAPERIEARRGERGSTLDLQRIERGRETRESDRPVPRREGDTRAPQPQDPVRERPTPTGRRDGTTDRRPEVG